MPLGTEKVLSEESPLLVADSKMGKTTESRPGHDVLFIIMTFAVTVMLVITLLFNFLSGTVLVDIGWFLNTTGDRADEYYNEISPAGWTFSVWTFIYIFQIFFVLYLLISLCRRSASGPLYLNPPMVNSLMLVLYFLNLALNVSWLFLWDREVLPVALVFIALIAFTLYLALFIHHRLVYKSGSILWRDHRVDLIAARIIIQNGLAMYATWVSIATLLNFTTVLSFLGGVPQSDASTVSLSILLVEVLLYFVLDNVVWDRYLRYTYTPWMVVIFAMAGSLDKNWSPGSRNSIYSVVLIALASVMFIIKLVLSVWRAFRSPLYQGQKSVSKQELAMA